MGVESFGGNYDIQQTSERNNEQVVSSLNDSRREIGDKAIKYYEINKNDPDRVQSLHDFIQGQEQDRTHLKEQLEAPVLSETRNELDKQAMINEAKTMLYEKLGISENISGNNWGENFGKGLVDTLILDNYDLAIQVWETNGTVIIDGIKQLFSSWENIKKVAEALRESVMGLFSLDGYQTGKSIAELGLIGSGIGAGVFVGKKAFKLGMKQISKLRKSAEKVVESSSVKQVIGETTSRVDEIVPKKELDVRGELLSNLPENIRNLDLELDNYSPQQLEGLKQRLGLDSHANFDDIDLDYRLKLKDTLDRYKELSDVNLARFGKEILEELKKSGDLNPLKTLENEILKLELMKNKGELLVVSAMSDEVVKSGIKFNHFANLDRIGYNDFKSPLGTKEGNLQYRIDRNYNELRGITDNLMGVEGLDPIYLSLVISKNDIHKLSQYGDNFMVFGVDELHGRATITMNDSMLAGRFNGDSLDTQLMHYSTETLIKAKAIYNIDERLGFPIFNRMRGEAFNENQRMKFFYQEMKPLIEVQVYGKTNDRVKKSLSTDDIIKKFKN